MQYMLLIYADESAGANISPEEGAKLLQEYTDYSQWLVDKGWMRGGDPLRDTEHATTVRVRGGEIVTTDGPFAETKGRCRHQPTDWNSRPRAPPQSRAVKTS